MDVPSVAFLEPWAEFYGGSTMTATATTALHLAGMLLSGGFAIAADRATVRALRHPKALAHQLVELEAIHRPVLIGLGVTIATGVLMLAADLDALIVSPVFWLKMVVLGGLVANGLRLRSASRHLRRDARATTPWRARLRFAAAMSATLWFAALVLGAILPST